MKYYFSFTYLRQPSLDEQPDIFDSLSWPTDTVTMSMDQSQVPPPSVPITTSANTTTELPPLLTLLLPMMNGVESNPPPPQPKPPAIIFSSNNGVIDDPLIQSLAAEQAASAHNYDLLSHRHKRVGHSLEVSFVHQFARFVVHYVMVINQLVLQTFNFSLVTKLIFLNLIILFIII
jgi:hypothetical protein